MVNIQLTIKRTHDLDIQSKKRPRYTQIVHYNPTTFSLTVSHRFGVNKNVAGL